MELHALARALGGDPVGGQVLCPGPRHGPKDRSLSVRFEAGAPGGFIVNSFAGDNWQDCADHVRALLGLPRHAAQRRPLEFRRPQPAVLPDQDNRAQAVGLWRRRKPLEPGLAETYIRAVRKYKGPIPATLGFLPAFRNHPPAIIAAYGLATEPEPGLLAIRDCDVRAVHLTSLTSAGEKIAKITFGRGAAGAPIVVAPPNDALSFVITEGIEDALSVHAATGMGAWAAGSASFMPALAAAVPAWASSVWIVADDNEAGRRGARGLVAGLRQRGLSFKVLSLGAAHEAG